MSDKSTRIKKIPRAPKRHRLPTKLFIHGHSYRVHIRLS